MMPRQLDYESQSRQLVRPWYLWSGAAVAVAWLLALTAVLAVLLGRAVVRNGPDAAGFGLALTATLVCCGINILGLVMEWHALVRHSANAAAGIGIMMALFAVLAVLATLLAMVVSHGAALTDIMLPGAIATALALAAFAHIRWAILILKGQEPAPDDLTPHIG